MQAACCLLLALWLRFLQTIATTFKNTLGAQSARPIISSNNQPKSLILIKLLRSVEYKVENTVPKNLLFIKTLFI